MNGWLVAATVLLAVGMPASLATALRGNTISRLVGLELAGAVVTLVLLLLAQGYRRTSYVDLAMVLALLQLGGSLVFARFLERWT